ncbi:MAG: Uma2 family endonuclease [Cyanobacteria bacterium J06641_5]
MSIALAKWTVADYHRMAAAGVLAGRRVELIAGDIVEMAPEGPLHRYTNAGVQGYFQELLGERALVLPPGPIELPDGSSEPEPDISVVAALGAVYKTRLPRLADIYWLMEISDALNLSLKSI